MHLWFFQLANLSSVYICTLSFHFFQRTLLPIDILHTSDLERMCTSAYRLNLISLLWLHTWVLLMMLHGMHHQIIMLQCSYRLQLYSLSLLMSNVVIRGYLDDFRELNLFEPLLVKRNLFCYIARKDNCSCLSSPPRRSRPNACNKPQNLFPLIVPLIIT